MLFTPKYFAYSLISTLKITKFIFSWIVNFTAHSSKDNRIGVDKKFMREAKLNCTGDIKSLYLLSIQAPIEAVEIFFICDVVRAPTSGIIVPCC